MKLIKIKQDAVAWIRKYFNNDSLLFSVIVINIMKDIDLNSMIDQIRIQDDLPIIKSGENKIKKPTRIFIKRKLVNWKFIILSFSLYLINKSIFYLDEMK